MNFISISIFPVMKCDWIHSNAGCQGQTRKLFHGCGLNCAAATMIEFYPTVLESLADMKDNTVFNFLSPPL